MAGAVSPLNELMQKIIEPGCDAGQQTGLQVASAADITDQYS